MRRLLILLFLFPLCLDAGLIFQLGPVVLENVTEAYGILRITSSFGASVFDSNKDGWPDLLISNHGLPPTVFINREGRAFREAEEILGLGFADRHSPAMADYDNDGDQDLYFLRGAHNGTSDKANEFFINPGKGERFQQVSNPDTIDIKGRGRMAIWFDYDQDGFLDLIVVNKKRSDAPNRLYHSRGDGSFADVTHTSGLGLVIDSEGGAIAADFDNDRDMDVFFANTENRPYLMMNEGNGTFRDETSVRGIPFVTSVWSASAADINNDGAIDLYLSRGSDGALAEGAVIAKHRLNFMQIAHAGSDRVDKLSFLVSPAAKIRVRFSENRLDINRLFVGANGLNPNKTDFIIGPGFISAEGQPQQWREDGSARGTFIWRDPSINRWFVATASGNSSEALVSGALLETESDLSALDTTSMESSAPKFPNVLLFNKGNGSFENQTSDSGTADPSNSRSALWVDLDNDSDLDLFQVNAGFNGAGKQPHVCYINEAGKFQGYALSQGPYEQFGRGDSGLIADFNKDGMQDLFILNGAGLLPANRGPYQLFLNRTHNVNRWISFRLIGAGKNFTNRDAIGARIEIRPIQEPGKSLWRFITGTNGNYSQSSRVLHFGLGRTTDINVRVIWPPGKQFTNGHQQSFVLHQSDLNRIWVVDERKGPQE